MGLADVRVVGPDFDHGGRYTGFFVEPEDLTLCVEEVDVDAKSPNEALKLIVAEGTWLLTEDCILRGVVDSFGAPVFDFGEKGKPLSAF